MSDRHDRRKAAATYRKKEIWEVENWGKDEWTEQALAERFPK
jgi:hypothetical protein